MIWLSILVVLGILGWIGVNLTSLHIPYRGHG